MTPAELINLIEFEFQEYGGDVMSFSQKEWLINRVKRLTQALELIAKDFGTDHCDGNTMIAKKALGNE